jgi:hypothetical protein
MDEPTKTTLMAALTVLLALVPAAAADETAPAHDSSACQPVWVDSQGQPHLDPTCIGPTGPLLDSRP